MNILGLTQVPGAASVLQGSGRGRNDGAPQGMLAAVGWVRAVRVPRKRVGRAHERGVAPGAVGAG